MRSRWIQWGTTLGLLALVVWLCFPEPEEDRRTVVPVTPPQQREFPEAMQPHWGDKPRPFVPPFMEAIILP